MGELGFSPVGTAWSYLHWSDLSVIPETVEDLLKTEVSRWFRRPDKAKEQKNRVRGGFYMLESISP